MLGSGVKICRDAAILSVKRSASGALRITYPRVAQAALAFLLLLAGAAAWLAQLPEEVLEEPLQHALALLLVMPGLWVMGKGLRPRPVIEVAGGELIVRYGPAFLEHTVARLPLDGLEVQVRTDLVHAVRYDTHAVSKRLLAALNPLASGRLPESEVRLYVLEVRNEGQEAWLPVLGSQVASEVENARLAILAAIGDVVAELAEDDVSEPEGSGTRPDAE
ncbi:MAG: hypothetical protein ABIF82_02475 [Planctomycetota bacterium]